MNNLIHIQGKRLWSIQLPAPIICMESLEIRTLGLVLTALGMADNRVMIYRDKHLVDTIYTEDKISALKFGRFGREDNTLVMVMKSMHSFIFIIDKQINIGIFQ